LCFVVVVGWKDSKNIAQQKHSEYITTMSGEVPWSLPLFLLGKKIFQPRSHRKNVVEFLEILWLPNGSSTIQGINQKEKHPWLPVKTLVDPPIAQGFFSLTATVYHSF